MSGSDKIRAVPGECLLALCLFAAAGETAGNPSPVPPPFAGPAHEEGSVPAGPQAASQLLAPEDLAKTLSSPVSRKPLVVFVGPTILYRSGHIPGAKLIGPASRPEELASLLNFARPLARGTDIVLYCGCCPWEHCPNVRPALEALQKLGFSRVKILHLLHDFKQDWLDKGYPVQRHSGD